MLIIYVLMAVIFLLIQCFLAMRPAKGWGLVLPAGFLLLALMSVLNVLPEVMGITYNGTARTIYTVVGLVGLGAFMLVYLLCRNRVARLEQERRRRYEAYLAAKRAQQQRSAAGME